MSPPPAGNATLRAFLAIPLPPPLQQALARLQRELAPILPGVRWTAPGSVHLTLRFFPSLPVDNLEKLRASMLSVTIGVKAFDLAVLGLGAFPHPHRARVLWAGLTPAEPLQRLYAHCEAILATAGCAPEPRPFRPHLTIGRCREGGLDLAVPLARYRERLFGQLPVDRLVLYRSELLSGGALHTPLFTVPLPGGDDCL